MTPISGEQVGHTFLYMAQVDAAGNAATPPAPVNAYLAPHPRMNFPVMPLWRYIEVDTDWTPIIYWSPSANMLRLYRHAPELGLCWDQSQVHRPGPFYVITAGQRVGITDIA
jgi:hypothetical protein